MTIHDDAMNGIRLNRLVIDAHAHLGPCHSIHSAYNDAAGLLASMDRIGIAATCLSSFQALGGDFVQGNNRVAEAAHRHPGRFLGYGVINPNYPEAIEDELTRCLDSLRLWAIKLHPTDHHYAPDGPSYQRVYAMLQERSGAVLSHTFGTPAILDKLSARYPNVTFIEAHVGGTYDAERAAGLAPLLRERENVYMDTVLSVVPYGHIERWVADAGADHILFGSDVPFNDNAHQIGRITHANLPEEVKEKILGLNMRRVLAKHGVSIVR